MHPDRRREVAIVASLALAIVGIVQVDKSEEGRSSSAIRSDRQEHPHSLPRQVQALSGPQGVSSGGLRALVVGKGEHKVRYVAGEVLVRPKEGVSQDEMASLALSYGSRILGHGGRSGLYRLGLPSGESISSFENQLRGDPEIREALPHAIAVGTSSKITSCPSSVYRGRQWNLDSIQHANACASYDSNLSSVTVAVLDTGVAYEDSTDNLGTYLAAPDLSNVSFVSGYDFVNDDSHPNDDNQHGTHIAGIIAAQGKVTGVAPGVNIMPVKVLDSYKEGTELNLVEGIYYAVDHGANIINMSLTFGLGFYPSSSLQDAIAYAASRGVVMVASAGNTGTWGIGYPAAFPDVISVGASRMSGNGANATEYQAPYSNRGYRIDLLAPGGFIAADDGTGNPNAILAQTFRWGNPTQLGYWYFSGTSQAAAHVSAVAAWLLADGVAPANVRPAMVDSAYNMRLSEFDPYVGSGRVQLQAARDAARQGVTAPPSYYVNLLPRLVQGTSGGKKAVVRIQVMTSQGQPAVGVRVGGSWFGSYTAFDGLGVTGSSGVVELTSGEVASASGVAIGFQVDMVTAPGSRAASQPRQFFSLSPASAELYSRLLEDPVNGQAEMLFRLDPADLALNSLFDRTGMVTSYVMTPVGAGLATGPLSVVFDDAFAPSVTQAAANQVTAVSWTFPGPLYSGWGNVNVMTGTRVEASSASLGSASRYLIVPLDPANAQLDLNHFYPVVNAPAASFSAENVAFGNGFAASAMGSGFAASAMGSGYASRSLGDGFAASAMGSGFAASAMGSGFAASAMGSGFAASAMGSGFAASAMGTGFALSAMGASNDSTESSATAYGKGIYIATATDYDPVIDGLLGVEGFEIDAVDSTALIGSEEELENVIGEAPYPR